VNNDDTNMTACSGGVGWREIQEQQAWDEYLAWCRAQEGAGRGD
jgi:hypothetical protein